MEKSERFTEENRKTIEQFVCMPVFLIGESEVLCLNEAAKELRIREEDMQRLYASCERNKTGIQIKVTDEEGSSFTLRLSVKPVEYQNGLYLLGEVTGVERYEESREDKRFSYAYRLMLEMTQKIHSLETDEDMYSFILEYSKRAVKDSALCSIMIIEDGYTKIVAKSGFDDEVYAIRFRPEDTFLYRATQGKCDEIVNMGDLSHYYDTYYPASVEGKGKQRLRSSISAPFYLNSRLAGMINFDSLQTYAFDNEDVELLTLVRNNVEIALANHMLYQQMKSAAACDYLTGLNNRRHFEKYFEGADKDRLWLVMFDLDNLKPISDGYGHAWGDRVLCDFAERLADISRDGEVGARIGGDEFAAIFYAENEQELTERLEGMKRAAESTVLMAEGKELHYSFSYGMEPYNGDVLLETLLRKADARMYRYKVEKRRMSDKEKNRK